MGRIFDDLTKTIGNTPLVRLNRITEGVEATGQAKKDRYDFPGRWRAISFHLAFQRSVK